MLCRAYAVHRIAVMALAALLLAACNPLVNGPVYDADIEAGLNEYHRDTTAFVVNTVRLGPAGTYDSPDSREFYARSGGILNNLTVRAEAADPGGACPPARLAQSGLDALVSATLGRAESTALEETEIEAVDLKTGSCLAVSLKAVIVNHSVLERFHKKRNALRPVQAQIAQGGIDDAVRLALIQIRAAKP